MIVNHMECPCCGHDFFIAASQATCPACGNFFYVQQSQTRRSELQIMRDGYAQLKTWLEFSNLGRMT